VPQPAIEEISIASQEVWLAQSVQQANDLFIQHPFMSNVNTDLFYMGTSTLEKKSLAFRDVFVNDIQAAG